MSILALVLVTYDPPGLCLNIMRILIFSKRRRIITLDLLSPGSFILSEEQCPCDLEIILLLAYNAASSYIVVAVKADVLV